MGPSKNQTGTKRTDKKNQQRSWWSSSKYILFFIRPSIWSLFIINLSKKVLHELGFRTWKNKCKMWHKLKWFLCITKIGFAVFVEPSIRLFKNKYSRVPNITVGHPYSIFGAFPSYIGLFGISRLLNIFIQNFLLIDFFLLFFAPFYN